MGRVAGAFDVRLLRTLQDFLPPMEWRDPSLTQGHVFVNEGSTA
jgi:hypothetical protein